MKAELVSQERRGITDNSFVDVKIWRVPHPIRGSALNYKYSLALVVGELCVLRYDNEAGEGLHRRVGEHEEACQFSSLDRLVADFMKDVRSWPKQ